MFKDYKVIVLQDGFHYDRTYISWFNGFEQYLNVLDSNTVTPNFVGFIIKKNIQIVSFPKNYRCQDLDVDIKILGKLLIQNRRVLGNKSNISSNDNFPIDAYLSICDYFLRHGLYREQGNRYTIGYSKRISWNKTIRKNNVIINNNNILFFPFVLETSHDISVFITECMKEALKVGFERFGNIFEIGVPYIEMSNINIFGNKEKIIRKLEQIFALNYKDSTKLLIRSLINFFKWEAKSNKELVLATKNFELIWEQMVDRFLCSKLIFDDQLNSLMFNRKAGQNAPTPIEDKVHRIEIKKNSDRDFKVIFDHVFVDGDRVFLFDSKYFSNEPNELNYKQFSYDFFLKDYLYRNIKKEPDKIINGLIFPTDKDNYRKVHLRINDNQHHNIRGITIEEFYFNIREIIIFSLQK